MSQNISDLCKCWQFYLQWLGCIRQLSLCSQLTPGLPVVWALQHCCFSRVTHTTTGCLKCRCSGHLTLFITERVIFYWTCESWTVITCWTCYQIILHGCGYGSKVFPIRFWWQLPCVSPPQLPGAATKEQRWSSTSAAWFSPLLHFSDYV